MYTHPVEGLHRPTQGPKTIYTHLHKQDTCVYAISQIYSWLVLDHTFKIPV